MVDLQDIIVDLPIPLVASLRKKKFLHLKNVRSKKAIILAAIL